MSDFDWHGWKEIPAHRDPSYIRWEFRRAAQRVIRWIDDNIFIAAVALCLFTAAATIALLGVVGR